MNQILVVENRNGKKNNNTTVDIKKIVLFFSVAIIIFGVFLIISGVSGLKKNKSNNNNNSNIVGTVSPSPQATPTLDIPSGEDEEAPVIELMLSGDKVKIIATDETEMDYIEYRWNDEEETRVEADENSTEIETSVIIKQGVNVLNVVAVDKAGNTEEKTQAFQGKTIPEVKLYINNEERDKVVLEASCADGISKLEFSVNGGGFNVIPFEGMEYTKEDWAGIGVNVEFSDDGKVISVQYKINLLEGENNFYAYAYSLSGLVGESNATTTYPAQ